MNANTITPSSRCCLRHTSRCHPTRWTATSSSRLDRTAVCQASLRQHQQHAQTHSQPNHGPEPLFAQLQQGVRAAARVAFVGAATVLCLCWSPAEAEAAGRKAPPINESAGRCDVSALDKFADTRAAFSQEASGGNMTEAIVDVRGCDFSNKDLSGKVFSGVLLQGADLSNTKVVGSQFARAQAQEAVMVNTDFTDTNLYGTSFDGADVRGAQFENSILTGATFGKDSAGNWANLAGAHFEGALVSSSDVGRICQNPTLEESTKKYELGCRATR